MQEMRRKDRQLPQEAALALLEEAEYGILSTAGSDGQPYGVPLNYVLKDKAIYFHCARTGHKLLNIEKEPRVSFCVVGSANPVFDGDFTTNYESVIAFGRASFVTDEAEKHDALTQLCLRYLPQHADKVAASIAQSGKVTMVVRIDIEEWSGKARAAK